MKKAKCLLTLGAALLFAGAFSANAQTWQIILPSPVPGSAPTGLGRDLLINPFISGPAPGVFLATEKANGLDGSSIFRVTPTDAAFLSFTLEPINGDLASVARLSHNPGDGLYAVGHSFTTTGSKGKTQTSMSWKVLRSEEAHQGNANTWLPSDSFQLSSTKGRTTTTFDSRAYGVTSDASGNVYVCGRASDGSVHHWIVRKKSGTTWDTVLDMRTADAYNIPYDICFVPAGANNPDSALFVVGIFNNRWTVLRKRAQDLSWQAVGPWPSDGSLANAYDVASDSNGNIYVVGVRGADGANKGWVLRRSTDGGTTWDTLLDKPSANSWAVRLSIDGSDNITLAGAIDAADGLPRWAIVRNAPDQAWSGSLGASWETRIFPFGANATFLSKGRGMVTDANGNLFLTGDVIDWTDPDDNTSYAGTRVGLLRLVP